MKLPENRLYEVARRVISSEADKPIARALGRDPYDHEANELYECLFSAASEVLANFEFADNEPSPSVHPHQVWADDHKGESYRRPKGHVVYTVTGEVVHHRHGLIRGLLGIEVYRSSDGKAAPMRITELESMVLINPQMEVLT